MILPFKSNKLYKMLRWAGNSGDGDAEYEEVNSLDAADIVSSQWAHTALHTVVLDIDVPAMLVESSTPGHHHLYVSTLMSWEKYAAVLNALADAGIIEDGYRNSSLARGFSAVRLPWIGKGYAAVDKELEGAWFGTKTEKADEPS